MLYGNLEIKLHDQNKIVLDIEDENFEFSLNGFGKESEEKILIHHDEIHS